MKQESLFKIIRYASKAPSGHNTQPWRFKTGDNSISLLPDLTRSLPVADSDNHELYISLGCALENLIIAATEFNYKTEIEYIQTDTALAVRVSLYESGTIEKSELFSYIERRQVTRRKYKPDRISYKILSQIFKDPQEEGVCLKLFLHDAEINRMMPYIIEGNSLQFRNKAFVNELIRWLRFSEEEVMHNGDGIWLKSMGLPNTGRFFGNIMMRHFVSVDTESRRIEELIHASSGLALFMVKENNPVSWIKLGRFFQRFGLRATKFNVSHSHVNMPCEELQVRERLIHDFQLKDFTPLLLIRFGYSDPLPYSFRRNLYDMIDK